MVSAELQLNCYELQCIYDELQLYNSCNLFDNIHSVEIWLVASDHCNSKTMLQGQL
jgi:hypothetical protein